MIGLHVTVEFACVIRDLDVDRWQAVVIPSRVAANVHAHLSGMSGRVLADEARKLRPGLRVLFTTGYSRNAIIHQGRLDPGVQLISKPFTFEQLAAKLRDVFDGNQGG